MSSKLVDERVVELQFDNSNFERNTRQSMSTIQKLKSSLNFSGVSNSINKSVNSVDMNPITYGLSKAGQSFSAFEVAAISAISNVTNRIVDLGIRLVESLSVDNIAAGWTKFEESTKSIGTLVSQGYEMSNVTEQMDRLLWYTDQTSYSYQDMVSNIAKFTATGQDLEDSVEAMMGIANWAAASGQNATVASRAMYQLSQAMGMGSVKLMDWRSIQNANMDTKEFRELALDTAVAAGELTAAAERFDGVTEYVTKAGNTFTTSNFTEFMSSDGWFTSDVLMSTLQKYSSAVNTIMDLQNNEDHIEEYAKRLEDCAEGYTEEGLAALKAANGIYTAADAIEEYERRLQNGEEGYDAFGLKVFKAAQEARTFTDAINATKDAVSTGWLKTYTSIIGNYEQATSVWTHFADDLYEIFAEGAEKRNKAFADWNAAGGRDDLFSTDEDDLGAIWNIIEGIKSFVNVFKEAWGEVFPMKKSLKDITESFQQFTKKLIMSEETTKNVKNIFKGLFSVFKLGVVIFKGIKTALQPVIDLIIGSSDGFLKFFGDAGASFSEWVSTTEIFNKIGARVAKVLSTIINTFKELQVIDKIKNTFVSLKNELKTNEVLIESWENIKTTFSNIFDILLKGFKGFLTFSIKYLIPAIVNIVKYFGLLLSVVGGIVVKGIKLLVDSIQDLYSRIKSNETIQNGWKEFIEFMKSIPSRLKKLAPFFSKLGTALGNFFKSLWEGIKTVANGIASVFHLKTIGEIFSAVGDNIAYGFSKILEAIRSLSSSEMSSSVDGLKKKLSPLATLFKGIIDLFKGLWAVIKALMPIFGKILSAIGALLTSIADSLTKTFEGKDIISGTGIDLKTLLKGGLVALIGKGLYDFVAIFKNITFSISEVLGSLGSVFKAKAAQMWAQAIKDIAVAMLMMVGAIIIITLINPDKLWNAVGVLGTIMGALAAVMIIMGKFMKTSYKTSSKFMKNKKGMKFTRNNEGSGFNGVGMMVLSFGLAVLALVAALKIIDTINPDKIWKDLGILMIIMTALATAVGLMNMISNIGDKTKKGVKGVKGLLGFGLAILILTIPIKKLGELPTNIVWKGVAVISALAIAFGTMIRIMHGFKAKGVGKMAVFAAAMLALVGPIQLLGELPAEQLKGGVAAVAIIALSYGVMSRLASKMSFKASMGFIASIYMFGKALEALVVLVDSPLISSVSNESLGKFGFIFGGLVLAVMGVLNSITKLKTGKNLFKSLFIFVTVTTTLLSSLSWLISSIELMNNVNPSSVIMTLLSMASMIAAVYIVIEYSKTIVKRVDQIAPLAKKLAIFMSVLVALTGVSALLAISNKLMNDVKWASLIKSVIMLSSLMGATALVIQYAKRVKITNKVLKNIMTITSVLSVLTTMALLLSVVAQNMKGVGIADIGKTLLLLGTSLLAAILVVAVASKFSKQIKKVSTSLLMLGAAFALFGASVVLFTAAVQLLSGNIKSLLIFIGVITVLSLVMSVLSKLAPGMLTIAVVFGIMGAAALAIGAGFYLMVNALNELLPNLDALSEKSDSITTVISSMTEGMVEGFAKALPVLIEQFMLALDAFVQDIIGKVMGIFDFIKKLDISDVMDVLDSLLNILLSLLHLTLDKLQENIGPIIDKLITILINAVDAITNRLPELMQSMMNLIISFIDALGMTIENNAERIRETMVNFCKHLWNAFLNFFGIHSPSKKAEGAATNIIQGIIQGIGKGISKAVKAMVDLAKKMWDGLKNWIKKFGDWGKNIIQGIWNGIKSVWTGFTNFWKNIWNSVTDWFCDLFGIHSPSRLFYTYGQNTIDGYQNGLDDGKDGIYASMEEVYDETADVWNDQDIYEMYGEQIAQALADALINQSGVIYNVINQMITDSLNILDLSSEEFKSVINNILTVIESEITDEDLTIKPVMDLSEIVKGTGEMAAMFASAGGAFQVSSSSKLAEQTSADIAAAKTAAETNSLTSTSTQVTNPTGQNGDIHMTFNITGNDPKAIADEVSKRFQQLIDRRNAVNGHC